MQTWTWDGTLWTQENPAVQPPQRGGHAIAYDEARQRVVCFGGVSYPNVVYADTWEWDGTTWTQATPLQSPSGRCCHVMAYDSARRRIVLYGGFPSSSVSTDTWEYDGTTWTQVMTASAPYWLGYSMAYDVPRQRMGLFSSDAWNQGELWLLGATVAASHQQTGPGCGSAVLDAFGEPALGSESFALDVSQASAMAPLAWLLSAQAASIPIGPCTLHLDPTQGLALPGRANGCGFGSLRIPVPAQPSLLGATVQGQSVVLEPNAPLGLVLTNALSLRVGE